MDNSIRFINKNLNDSTKMPHQASSLGYRIFLLKIIENHSLADDLILGFMEKLRDWNLEDLWSRQVNYGIIIAQSEANLEYEEMHKLFSLCDEIYALEQLGVRTEEHLSSVFKNSVKDRFSKEYKKAKMVSNDKFEDWKSELWWYQI